MEAPDRKFEKTILAIIVIGFVMWSVTFIYRSSFVAIDGRRYFCLFDDAMISMRYAWNFSHGLGLVWNPGEYIQGYTNLLMTLVMSFATLVFEKSTASLFMQILGVGLMLAIACINMKISDYIFPNKKYPNRALIRILSFFCALSYYPLVYWTLMGMETGLLTLLILLSILFAFDYTKSKIPSHLYLMSACLGFAYLTRNDSLIFAFLIFMYIILETSTTRLKINWRMLVSLLGPIVFYSLFVFGQSIFQYLYYGEFLPNTYTLKLTGMPLLSRINNGVGFVAPFLKVSAFILVLSAMELVFAFQKEKLLLFSIGVSGICYQIYVGGDAWNYWRIMSPTMPLLTILFISTINAAVLAISSTQAFKAYFLRIPILPEKLIVEILIVSFTLLGLRAANVYFLPEISFSVKPYQTVDNQVNVNTALAINQLTKSDASVGVYWAGSIPYFTDRKAIDFLGKSDKYIAQLSPDVSGSISWDGMRSVPGHNKYDLNYSIKVLEPTYVQDFQWGTQDLSEWGEKEYVDAEYNGIRLFLLKDSPSVYWNKVNVP